MSWEPNPATLTDIPTAGAPTASRVTQNLYARTSLAPYRVLAVDPSVTTGGVQRLWGQDGAGNIAYTDNNGTSYTTSTANPDTNSYTAVGIYFSNNYMWVLTGTSTTSRSGAVYRSPLPAANGTGLTWTKVFDLNGLANGPGGSAASGHFNSTFRNSSFAIAANESNAYLLEYGAGNTSLGIGSFTDAIMSPGTNKLYSPSGAGGTFSGCTAGATVTVTGAGASGATLTAVVTDVLDTKTALLSACAQTGVNGATANFATQTFGTGNVIGGPGVYVSSNPGTATAASVTWSSAYQFLFARHGHAIKIVGGVPWVTLGDYPFPGLYAGQQPQSLTYVGLWAATSATAGAWNQKWVATPNNPYAGINFLATTIGGQPCLVLESDTARAAGPLVFPNQSNATGVGIVLPACTLPFPYIGTQRSMVLTPQGNLMWVQTGEGGTQGPLDSVCIAKPPFNAPVILESVATSGNTFGSLGDGTVSNGYYFAGTQRMAAEKFLGQ